MLSTIKEQADQLATCQQEPIQEVIKPQLLKLVDVWSQIMTNINEERAKRGQQDKELNDFKQLARHLIGWIEETKVKLQKIGESIQKSSVEKLKDSFHQVNVSFSFFLKKLVDHSTELCSCIWKYPEKNRTRNQFYSGLFLVIPHIVNCTLYVLSESVESVKYI